MKDLPSWINVLCVGKPGFCSSAPISFAVYYDCQQSLAVSNALAGLGLACRSVEHYNWTNQNLIKNSIFFFFFIFLDFLFFKSFYSLLK